jgi:hypothetical protein
MRYLTLYERFYTPPPEIKKKLDGIVQELLKKYGGGKEFFNALDGRIKDITNEDIIISLMRGKHDQWISTSGEFGDRLYELWKSGKVKCRGMVVFNGKMLTNNKFVENWYPEDFQLENKKFIYIDDSYFSGSTVRKVEGFLSQYNSIIKSVHVIYDGSKSEFVNSFFRYYS